MSELILDSLLDVVREEVVRNDQAHLQLVDTVANGDLLTSAPDQTIHLDSADASLHNIQISLVICNLKLASRSLRVKNCVV